MPIFSTTSSKQLSRDTYEKIENNFYNTLIESSYEMVQLNSALYISDVMIEEAIFEGITSPEILLEGLVKDAVGKIKLIFQKFWEKIRGWFKKIGDYFKSLFKSGEKINKQYGDKIKSSGSSSSNTSTSKPQGFTYKGFKYTMRDGEKVIKEKETIIFDFIEKQSAIRVKFFNFVNELLEIDRSIHDDIKLIKAKLEEEGFSYDINEDKEKLLKELGGSSLSEIHDIVFKAFRNGKSEKETFKDFSGNSKDELKAFVMGRGFNLFFENSKKRNDEAFNQTLADIEKIKNIIEKNSRYQEEKSKLIPFINYNFQLVHYGLVIINSLYDIGFKAYKEAYNEAKTVLNEYLNSEFASKEEKIVTNLILKS